MGFSIYKIWQILKGFAGTFRRAQTLKLGGVIWYMSYSSFVFMEHLIVLAHRNTENNSGDIFETVDPFFTLGTLASNIEQPIE